MTLNNEEKEILKIFAKYNPFSLEEIEWTYSRLKSYDMVLLSMQMSTAFNEKLSNVGILIKTLKER